VHAGNRVLLYREQHDIIDRFYVDMRMHSPPLGRMFTYGLTLAGKPAVPGAKGYCDVFPFTLTAPLSRRLRLALRTPLAAGNLALFASRWRLIDTDTLPTYTRLISERVREARSLVKSSIAQRMLKFRLGRRLGWITLALLTHWRLGVEQAPTAAAGTRDAVVDLRTPPRESWILGDLQRREFELSVLLPGRRSFSCNAVLAALIGPTADAPPNRFTIKLTPMNLAEARRTLNRFARDWGIDADEIALWSQRAAAASTASHAYSTRVFPAAPISFVRLEIQVEHHLNDDTYVIDVLYSWGS
jgi:hypothetical protein